MKSSIILIASMAGLLALPALAQDDHPKKLRVLGEAGTPGDRKAEHRVIIRHGDEKREMETVAFLGVETMPVGAALTAQLGLAKDTGLVIRHVVPESPAAGVLQAHDVLLKLDDQLLIEPRQFSVLVRNHKAGDEVTVAYVRGGKQSTAKIKLAQHDVPKFAGFDFSGDEGNRMYFRTFVDRDAHDGARDVDHMLSLLAPDDESSEVHSHRIPPPDTRAPGFRSSKVDTANSNMTFSDEEGSLELAVKGGHKTLVAKNPKGEQIFSGSIDKKEERDALPANVRQRLEKLEGMEEFNFRADDDVERDFRVFQPEPTKITLPPLPPAPATREIRAQVI